MKLRKLLIPLILCLVLTILPIAVSANGSLSFGDLLASFTSGPCGENVTWKLDQTGTLTIAGTGPMKDYDSGASAPWYHKRTSIKAVVIEAGVTAIGSYAFDSCEILTDVYYDGTRAKWNTVSVGDHNEPLLNAALHLTQTTTGDLDQDDALTTDDAVYLLLHVMFGEEDYPVPDGTALDFNGDGKTDTDDAVYLLLHVMFGEEDYPLSA